MPATIKGLSDGLQKIATLSLDTIKSSVESASKNMGEINKLLTSAGVGKISLPFAKKDNCDCCPPGEDCPPHCLLQITRNASAGERIVVPFLVKNTCGSTKTYRVGVRDLKNIDGSLAPSQPQLNKNTVTLDAGASEMVLMQIDLIQYPNGGTYNAEIVIREKDINQNICFKLTIDGDKNVPVAQPVDEKKYRLHWQSWRSHFYCETPLKTPGTNQPDNPSPIDTK